MNFNTIHYLNVFLGASAILLQVVVVFVLSSLFFQNKKNFILSFLKKHFLIISFLISLFASLFSLAYSEVIGFAPCHLCWIQRVFLFPQVFLFGIAFWYKDIKVIKYSLPLLCCGFAVALYQNFIYYFKAGSIVCDVSGVSCLQKFVNEFGGYISIPMLALTCFVALITLILVAHFYQKYQKENI